MSSKDIDYAKFLEEPWKHEHTTYDKSFLDFSNVPEYGPSEVLLASLYRRIGLRQKGTSNPVGEGKVGSNGTRLKNTIAKSIGKKRSEDSVSAEAWQRIVDKVIRSPKTPSQGKSNFIQTTPIVPSAAIYSMAARLKGQPWNPGALIESSITYGEESEESANDLWKSLFEALSVKEDEDDGWAVFLEREFANWDCGDVEWVFDRGINYESWMSDWQSDGVLCPARRFTSDLRYLLKAKTLLTRRQWTSLVEAILRIGICSQVLWVSKVNQVFFEIALDVLKGAPIPSMDDIRDRLSTGDGFWNYGQLVHKQVKKIIREYVYGRLGINLILHRCDDIAPISRAMPKDPFSSISNLRQFLSSLADHREDFGFDEFQDDLGQALEDDPRKISLKHGTGKNLIEFLRHTLGQRETQERGLEGYDQGYLACRKGDYRTAPLVLEAGSVMILALVYACSCDGSGMRTVEDLCEHLGQYGIRISPDEIAGSKLGKSLRTLGLVLDSPDAEGGMVLLNPFEN